MASDYLNLEKTNLEISDELKSIRIKILYNEKTELDFVRVLQEGPNSPKRKLVRGKLVGAINKFFTMRVAKKEVKEGEDSDSFASLASSFIDEETNQRSSPPMYLTKSLTKKQ